VHILINLYYADSARYFNYVYEHLLERDKNIAVTFVCFYPSAYLYLHRRGLHPIYLPSLLRQFPAPFDERHLSANIDELTYYNYLVMGQKPEYRSRLNLETKQCLLAYEKIIKDHSIDMMISAGDTRLQTQAAIAVAKSTKLRILYFEQGAFGTTILDPAGVNANVSFRNDNCCTENNDQTPKKRPKKEQKAPGTYTDSLDWQDNLAEKLDLFWHYPLPAMSSYLPLFTQSGESFRKFAITRLKAKLKKISPKVLPQKYLLFPLQMPKDAQLVFHSPVFNDIEEVVTIVANCLPCDTALVIREHPNYKDRYPDAFYELIENKSNVFLNNENHLEECIQGSEAVIVVNSTVGIEALSFYKNVILLGNAYYESDKVFHKVKSKGDLPRQIINALTVTADHGAIDTHISHLLKYHLLPGHFRDIELTGGEQVAEKIISTYTQGVQQP